MGGKVVKYGYLFGPIVSVKIPAAASQNFEHLSGCFVKLDSAERADIAEATDTELFGWAFIGDFTTSSTAGQTILTVNISLDAVYLMPINAAKTEAELQALMGKVCDLIYTSNIQYADLALSTYDVIQLVGYEYWGSALGEQAVKVRLNPAKIGATGVV